MRLIKLGLTSTFVFRSAMMMDSLKIRSLPGSAALTEKASSKYWLLLLDNSGFDCDLFFLVDASPGGGRSMCFILWFPSTILNGVGREGWAFRSAKERCVPVDAGLWVLLEGCEFCSGLRKS